MGKRWALASSSPSPRSLPWPLRGSPMHPQSSAGLQAFLGAYTEPSRKLPPGLGPWGPREIFHSGRGEVGREEGKTGT